jgi:hypothetical protein
MLNKIGGFVLITFFFICTAKAETNFRSSNSLNPDQNKERYLKKFSAVEADRFLAEALSNFIVQEIGLKFEFIHKDPHASQAQKRSRITGYLYGKIHQGSQRKRIILTDESNELIADYIFHQGLDSFAWKRNNLSDEFVALADADINKPLVDKILFSPADILMPYLEWDNYNYLGPSTMGIRGAVQKYSLFPGHDSNFEREYIDSILVAIDSDYKGIRKIKYLKEKEVMKELTISGLKKIKGKWWVSRMIIKDPKSKICTTFKVVDEVVFDKKSEINLFDPKTKFTPFLD